MLLMDADEIKDTSLNINLYRPTYFCNSQFLMWDEIYDLIENSEIPVRVNGMYRLMKEYCDNRQGYGGGGFNFVFWFLNETDMKLFDEKTNEIFKKYTAAVQQEYKEKFKK